MNAPGDFAVEVENLEKHFGSFKAVAGVSFAVRRGESDREAVRRMREIVREGNALGMFAEGTRQRSGVPGPVQPGAAMVPPMAGSSSIRRRRAVIRPKMRIRASASGVSWAARSRR